MQPKTELDDYILEDCYLYNAEHFITTSMSYNDKLGKLCALRKKESPKKKNIGKNEFFLLEIYNVIDIPCVFLEKSVPITDTSVEAITWLDDLVVCTCFDGSLICISPFTTLFKRFQITPSPIWCITALSAHQIVVGTDSGFIIFVERENDIVDGDVSLVITKSFQLGFEQRILSITSSVKNSKIAVGTLDKIYLLEKDRPENQKIMPLTQENAKSTIPWSLVFAHDNLFCGDSRGKLTIYSANNGALLKTISTHEADILSLCTNGKDVVYAAGVDFRIQTINVEKNRSDWANVEQRLYHTKDVRTLVWIEGKWLASAGLEPLIYISKNDRKIYHPIKKSTISISPNFNFLLLSYSNALELWHRAVRQDEPPAKKSKITVTPKQLCRLELGQKFITHAAISHDARFIYAATWSKLLIYTIKTDVLKILKESTKNKTINKLRADPSSIKKFGEIDFEQTGISAMISTSAAVFLACGEFIIKKVFITKENELKETTFMKKAGMSSVRMLRVNQAESMLLALTLKNLIVIMDISSKGSKVNKETIQTVQINQLILDCRFFDNTSILLLGSSFEKKLSLIRLEGAKNIGNPIANASIFEKKSSELGVSLSEVVNGSVVMTSSKGNFVIISGFDQDKRIVKYEDRGQDRMEKDFSIPTRNTHPVAFFSNKNILLC